MYMQMIFIDSNNDARLTGIGAEYDSYESMLMAFEALRLKDVGVDNGDFILDLHDDNDDLLESIAISAESYTDITGMPVLSEAEYIAIDEKLNHE